MPMVLPVVAAFASGAVSAVIAGTASFAAYATVAGAVMSVAGAITGSKDLQRLGAIVGIVGGVAGFMNGAASAASSTASAAAEGVGEAAVSGMDLAADAAAGSANSISGASGGLQAAADSAAMVNGGNGVQAPMAYAGPGSTGAGAGTDLVANTPSAVSPVESLSRQAMQQGLPSTPGAASASVTPSAAAGVEVPSGMDIAGNSAAGPNSLNAAAKQYNAGDLNSWWDKAMKAGKDVGRFVRDNKELVQMGGTVLQSVYGPQAEANDMQRSLMEQARRNINTPVVLKYKGA
jgi:trimeric autotransporter adhesin